MVKMTIRERIMAVYRNQVPDQTPISIYPRFLPRGTIERAARNMGLGIVDFYPVVSLLAPPWHTYPGYVSEVRGADFNIRFSWDNGHTVETRIYSTPVGTVTQRIKKDPAYESDWIVKFYISSLSDYRVMQYLVENTVFRSNAGPFSAKVADLGEDGVILGRVDRCPFQKLLIELAGPERFLVDLATDPEPVLELLSAMERKMDEAFDLVCESEAEVIWQPDNISCDMVSPKYFEKYCVPYYQKHGTRLHEKGKIYVVHMDGRLWAIRDLIEHIPIDCIESFSSSEIGGDLSLSDARAAWPGKVILPNFPSTLATQDEGIVIAFVSALRNEAGPRTPFVLQISEDLPPGSWQRILPILCKSLQS